MNFLGIYSRVLWYRGLKNYQYYFRGFLNYSYSIMGPKTLFQLLRPLYYRWALGLEFKVQGFRCLGLKVQVVGSWVSGSGVRVWSLMFRVGV